MQALYVDESGSMTTRHPRTNPFFVIAIVRVFDEDKLRRVYKRFVSKNYHILKEHGKDRMFSENKFLELKGSCFDMDLKLSFIDFFCRGHLFDVFYIKVDNQQVKPNLYDNTSAAFNYIFKLNFEYLIQQGMLEDIPYSIHLDERNEKFGARTFLEQYINTELRGDGILSNDIKVSYHDSKSNMFVQVADIFSNIFYSQCLNDKYTYALNRLKKDGYIKNIFNYPDYEY